MGIPTREAYGKALATLGKDNDFLVLDADLAKATQSILFQKEFPERFFNMGISEGDMMTTAAGIAACGTKVFASTFAMFAAGRAFEQIRNSICYPNLPVVVAGTHGGVLIGEDGASHQAIEDVSLMRTIPNMTVLVPCDEYSVNKLMGQLVDYKSPAYIRAGRNACPDIYNGDEEITIGKGNVLKDGNDLTIIAMGDMVFEALEAANVLETEGKSVAVIDMHTVKPLDTELVISYAKTTGKIVTAEDHNIIGGLGSAVAEILAETGDAKLRRVGVKDTFGKSGTKPELQQYYGLNAEMIVKAAKELF